MLTTYQVSGLEQVFSTLATAEAKNSYNLPHRSAVGIECDV
jgi:hypothetical protein